MDPKRYRDSTAGRLVRAGMGDAAYWAFVPHPLPPAWHPDLAEVRLLSAADGVLQASAARRPRPGPPFRM